MSKRLAINEAGVLTYCTADADHIGKGRCNHTIHQPEDMTNESFMRRVQIINNMPYEKEKNQEIMVSAPLDSGKDPMTFWHSEEAIRNIMKFRDYTPKVKNIFKTHEGNEEAIRAEINNLFPGKSWIVDYAVCYAETGFDEDGIPYNENGITYFGWPEDDPETSNAKAFTSNGYVPAKDVNFDDYDILMFNGVGHKT